MTATTEKPDRIEEEREIEERARGIVKLARQFNEDTGEYALSDDTLAPALAAILLSVNAQARKAEREEVAKQIEKAPSQVIYTSGQRADVAAWVRLNSYRQ